MSSARTDCPSQWLPARPRWQSGCLAPWWSIVSALWLLILMTEHKQTRAGAAENALAAPWSSSGSLSPEISWDSRGEGRVLTIIPLISFHYYQYSSETLGPAWGQSQNKTASLFFNNKTLQWITKYYFKNYFTKLCWHEQIWCHFIFHWNNIWKINFIQ